MKTPIHDKWAKIAKQVLKIPPKRLTRSEVDSVRIGLGPHFPILTQRLTHLEQQVKPYKPPR
jgi:hypothetical protein